MAKFSKNEIVTLNQTLKVGDVTYTKGSRFVVEKTTSTKTHLALLDDKGCLTGKGINGGHSAIERACTSTNTKFVAPKAKGADVKKGDFMVFKEEYKDDELRFPVGTRIVIVKGGAKPAFETFYKQENKSVSYVSGLSVHPDFITQFLEKSEPVKCELTADFQMKGLKERTGEETRNFEMSLYYKGKKIGEASNDGYGGCHRIYMNHEAWNNLIEKGLEIAQAVSTIKGEKFQVTKHDIEENTVDFFLENFHGLSTYKDYIERYVRGWCLLVQKN